MDTGFKSLLAYQKSYDLAMKIFELTKDFPKEEKYSLTDQIRRSSRSVCANIAEAYRKRLYCKHYVMKLTDADGEQRNKCMDKFCKRLLLYHERNSH
jgi:four helix bundle protein